MYPVKEATLGTDTAADPAELFRAHRPGLVRPAEDVQQEGTVTLTSPAGAVFRDRLGHEVRFRLRPGATESKQLCEQPKLSYPLLTLIRVNRTDRLYALVEELRAVAPRPRSARWLANRFEVSVRTVERDISALQQSGTPIYAEPGRTGGYCLDKAHTMPPVNLTPGEAVAMALALKHLEATPFLAEGRSALRKLVAAMRREDTEAAQHLAACVHLLGGGPIPPMPHVLGIRRVLRIRYTDREGTVTRREIEPLGYVGKPEHWYLVAWCRLRREIRAFRTDRIISFTVTAEVPPLRRLRPEDLEIPYGDVHQLTLAG